MVSCCNRRLYKGNSYEICLPLVDSGVTLVRFYTKGDVIIEKEPEISGDSMCFSFTAEELASLEDGVLRYEIVTDQETKDTNSPYVVVTPGDYSGSTLDDLLEDAFDSGYTAGQEDCSGSSCNLQASKTVYLGGFEWSYDPGTEGPWARAPRYMISGSPVHISADTGYDGLEEIQLTGYFHPTEAYDDGYGKGFTSGYTAGREDCSGETINNQPWKTIDLWQLNKDDTSKFELLYSDKLGYYYATKPGVEVEATYDSGYTGLKKAGALFRLMPTEAINLGYESGYTAGQEDCDCEDAFDSGYTAGFLAGKRLCNPFTITNLSQDTPGEIELVLHVHRTGDTGCTTRLRTSTDGTNWSDEVEYSGGTFTIQPGQSLMFDGNSNEHWYPTQRYLFGGNLFGFRQSENNDPSVFFEVSGDIMTLMKQGNTMKNSEFEELFDGFSQLRYADGLVLPDYTATRCYENMFSNCTSLVSTPELPATALTGDYVYLGMFSSCSSLAKAPELPATVLAPGCYMNMFFNCTGLIEAPELKATGMASQCYSNMFDSCTSLTTAPELPATVMAPSCYMFMFGNCLSLTTPPELPATTLAESCYYGMFSLCRAFTTAPELPATVMAKNCYNYMFISCTGLTQAPELPATTLAEGCYEQMFSNCQSLKTSMEVLPATTLQPKCYKKMFEHCYSLLTTPELPASTLADNCYELMFYQCTGITSITCNATDITATDCTKDWVKVWSSDGSPKTIQTVGIFYAAPSMANTWVVGSTSGVPVNWTIETQPGPEPQSAATAITITVPQGLEPGDTGSTSVSTSPSGATTNLSYSSSDNSVATVDNNGNITAVGTGTTNICVTDSISQITECTQLTINNPGPQPVTGTSLLTNIYRTDDLNPGFAPSSAVQLCNESFYSAITEMTIDGVSVTPSMTADFSSDAGRGGLRYHTVEYTINTPIVPELSFKSITHLVHTVISGDCTGIGVEAFWLCENLGCDWDQGYSGVALSPNIVLSESVFGYCTRLKEFEIPTANTVVPEALFYVCSGLTSVTIHSGVTVISGRSFQQCHSLLSVELPAGLTEIGGSAFVNCRALTEIRLLGTVPPTIHGSEVFTDTNNCPIYVPAGSVTAYQTAWSQYASRIQAIQ